MQFVRKRKRGVKQQTAKMWFSEEGYRISWRKEVYGIQVPARFHACVRVVIPNFGSKEGETVQMWDFLSRPRVYKTLKAAQEDCEKHRRLWTKACEATGIRGLLDLFGKLPTAIPVWAMQKMNRKALAVLRAPRTRKYIEEESSAPDPSDPIEALREPGT